MTCGEHEKINLKDLEEKLNEAKAQLAEKVKPVEKCIADHPIPSVLVAAGLGILVGAVVAKHCCMNEE